MPFPKESPQGSASPGKRLVRERYHNRKRVNAKEGKPRIKGNFSRQGAKLAKGNGAKRHAMSRLSG